METTKTINGKLCRPLRKGTIIRETDLNDCGHPPCSSLGEKQGEPWRQFYRPILSPKKAKGKAKKVESVKAWGLYSTSENLIYPHTYAMRNAAMSAKGRSYSKVIRVEIRPLVTRKKGK